MRRSINVSLTLLPILATAAVASAEPPTSPPEASPPGLTNPGNVFSPPSLAAPLPELLPPSLTPDISELECREDPNSDLRTDCGVTTVVRGGFGHYFHPRGG